MKQGHYKIPRRSFLKGAGVCLALPSLEIMGAALSKNKSRDIPLRLAVFHKGNGIDPSSWQCKGSETKSTLPQSLQPLKSSLNDYAILANVSNQGKGDHYGAVPLMMTGIQSRNPKHTFDRDYFNKVSARLSAEEMVGGDITSKDIHPFSLPTYEEIEKTGVWGIHLGDYLFWDEERQTEWIKKGALVIPYGTMSALEFSLPDIMDKFVMDDWGQAHGIFGALREHIDKGKITFETLHAELGEIVCGLKKGREKNGETILFWHRGLSLSDIALGHKILSKAKEIGVGQKLRFA